MGIHDGTSDRRSVTGGIALGAMTAAIGLAGWRQAVGATTVAGPRLLDSRRQVQVPEGGQVLTGIGLPLDEWDAIYGRRTPLDDAYGLSEYANPDVAGLTLLVGSSDGLVDHIEYGYEQFDAGGISPDDAATQVFAVLPLDLQPTWAYTVNGTTVASVVYRYERYESVALDEATGGRYAVLVGYQEQTVVPSDGSAAQELVLRATVTLVTAAGSRGGTGEPGGLGMDLSDFEASYGPGSGTQSGYLFEDQAQFGGDILVGISAESIVNSLRFMYDDTTQYGGVGIEDAATDLTGALPADAVRVGLFFLPPTPGGPIGLTVEHWQSDTLAAALDSSGTALTVTWQQDVAGATVVSRIDVVTESGQ